MNLPNKLTVTRFGLTVVFLWALFWPWAVPFRYTFALFFFCLAGITDFLDGRIARARKLITNFGILMDPLADKIMTCSAFIAFVESTHKRAGRAGEVERVDGRRHRRARTGHHRVAAARGFKKRRAGGGTLRQAQDHFANRRHHCAARGGRVPRMAVPVEKPLRAWAPLFAEITLWVTVVLTMTSGVIYLWRNRTLYLSEM